MLACVGEHQDGGKPTVSSIMNQRLGKNYIRSTSCFPQISC